MRREVQVNLAYRWFCGLSISRTRSRTIRRFSRARNERFGNSNVFRCVFERIVGTCIAAGLVGGEGFCGRCEPPSKPMPTSTARSRARSGTRILIRNGHVARLKEYLATTRRAGLRRGPSERHAAKFVSPIRSCRAMDWSAAQRSVLRIRQQLSRRRKVSGIIMDVEASRAIRRKAEVGASQTMIERTEACFGIEAQMARGGQRLWFGLQPRLAGQRAGDRAACPSHRQIAA